MKSSVYRKICLSGVFVVLAYFFSGIALKHWITDRPQAVAAGLVAFGLSCFAIMAALDRRPVAPKLSSTAMRIVCGVLLLLNLLALANYYLLDPGVFGAYKKLVLVLTYVMMGAVVLFMEPVFRQQEQPHDRFQNRDA